MSEQCPAAAATVLGAALYNEWDRCVLRDGHKGACQFPRALCARLDRITALAEKALAREWLPPLTAHGDRDALRAIQREARDAL